MNAALRACSACGEAKPSAGFYPYPRGREGLTARCRLCLLAKQKEYQKRHKAVNAKCGAGTADKRCSRCGLEKPASEFCKASNRKGGLNSYCRPCHTAAKRHVARRIYYGLTNEAFKALVVAQNCRCGICGVELIEGRSMHVDHCHATGKVRGLLCGNCNRGLGSFRDDTARMRAAIEYLERSK